jgi:uncharacterized damage-inducible protein DinB
MNTDTLSPRTLAFGDLKDELATTRRLLEAVPEDHLDWIPHSKSRPLGALVAHLTNIVFWQLMILRDDGFDLGSSPPPRDVPSSSTDALGTFDANVAALEKVLENVTDETLAEPWTLRNGDEVIFTRPKAEVLREMGISHMIHHRAQLGVYLRLLDVPLPSTYGPTAG